MVVAGWQEKYEAKGTGHEFARNRQARFSVSISAYTLLSWWDLHLWPRRSSLVTVRAGHVLRSAILNTSSAVCLHWAAAACSACFSVIASVPFVSWPKRSS